MRDNRITQKDMQALKEADSAWEQHRSSRGALKDYSLKHKVTIEWEMNEDSVRDRICKLRIDDVEVLLDSEQLLRYLRWV